MLPSRRVQFGLHLALAIAGIVPTLMVPGSTVGDGVDAFGTHWFYWWIRFCIEHLGNPSNTPLFFFPFGKDVFAHTGNNFVDAVFSVPFQWVFGPTLYQPIFIVVLQLGNALSFRPLARYVLGDTFAAFAATVLWQINPFVLFEITAGRPTQAMAWYLPIAVLFLFRSAREPGLRNPLCFGLAVAMSAWTYWFTAYFLGFLLLPLAAWELAQAKDRRGALVRWAFAVLVCVVIVAPGVVSMWGAVHGGRVPGIDPAPGSIFEAPKPIANNVSPELHGLWLMEFYGSPLLLQPAWGIPLLILPFLRRLPIPGGRARWLAAFAFGLAFAGGPMFRIGDFTVLMPQYMTLYRYLPFFDRLWFPYRLAVVLFIPLALLVGAMCAMPARRGRALLAVLVLAGLGGQHVVGAWPFNHRYSKAPPMIASLRHEGGGVIFLPMKIQHDGLMWQTEFQLPTFGGMGESAAIFWPENFRKRLNNSFIKAMRGATITPNQDHKFIDRDRKMIEKEGFRWVIFRRSLLESELRRQLELGTETFDKFARIQEAVDGVSTVIGAGPVGVQGDAVLWNIQGTFVPSAECTPTPEHLAVTGWEEFGAPEYERSLEVIGRTGNVRERTSQVVNPPTTPVTPPVTPPASSLPP